jgi:hypothetical protein
MAVDTETGRCLGAVGSNFYTSWVFPLYTPNGMTVVREFPFDHPFHNGCYAKQNPVIVEGRTGNFWVAPPRRSYTDKVFVNVGRTEAPKEPDTIEPHEDGVKFVLNILWRDENEEPLIDEIRTVNFIDTGDATVCDITSEKISSYGNTEYPQTKYGSIGIRVEPRILPPFGGEVIGDNGRRGTAEAVHEQESDYVAYENEINGSRFGVLMHITVPDVKGPWFIRDYGMALFNPTWTDSINVSKGESWTIGLRIAAYDDALTEERANRWIYNLQLPICD